jgi:hypothetical protein
MGECNPAQYMGYQTYVVNGVRTSDLVEEIPTCIFSMGCDKQPDWDIFSSVYVQLTIM